MTNNEAYELAKKAWNSYKRKKTLLEVDQCLPNTIIKMRSEGYKDDDIKLVQSWIKAFRQGKPYP